MVVVVKSFLVLGCSWLSSILPYLRYINTTELVVGESECCKTFVILVEVKKSRKKVLRHLGLQLSLLDCDTHSTFSLDW